MILLYISFNNNILHYEINHNGDNICDVSYKNNTFYNDDNIYHIDDITIVSTNANYLPDYLFFKNLESVDIMNCCPYSFLIKHNFIKGLTVFNEDDDVELEKNILLLLEQLDLCNFEYNGNISIFYSLPKYIKHQKYNCTYNKCNGYFLPEIYYCKYEGLPIVAQNVLNHIIEFSGEYIDMEVYHECNK